MDGLSAVGSGDGLHVPAVLLDVLAHEGVVRGGRFLLLRRPLVGHRLLGGALVGDDVGEGAHLLGAPVDGEGDRGAREHRGDGAHEDDEPHHLVAKERGGTRVSQHEELGVLVRRRQRSDEEADRAEVARIAQVLVVRVVRGRLVLGDGVAYATSVLSANTVIDIATLTGAPGFTEWSNPR